MSVITPTVGRNIWYRPSNTDFLGPVPMVYTVHPLVATIIAVWDDRRVNVLVTDIHGKQFFKSSCALIQPGDTLPKDADGELIGGYVEWSPEQIEAEGIREHFQETMVQFRKALDTINEVSAEASAAIAKPEMVVGTDDAIEQAIVDTGANKGPRVTPGDIEANIVEEIYFTASDGKAGSGPVIAAEFWHTTNGHAIVDYSEHTHVGHLTAEKGYERRPLVHRPDPSGPLSLLTFCVLVLRNGFLVTGESACASPENFNAEIGRQIARQNAVQKIWPLMGYELRTRLAAI